jgi:hypothetical protein
MQQPPRTDGSISERPSKQRPQPDERARAEAPPVEAHLLVQAGGQGVDILARIDKFSLSERAGLRDRVAAMLSRHGFAARDIRINGISSGSQRIPEEGS